MKDETATDRCASGMVTCPATCRYRLKTQRSVQVVWLMATDALALAAAFGTAYWIRFELQITMAPEVVVQTEGYQVLAALLIPLWLLVFVLFNLYDLHAKIGASSESSSTFNACTVATMLVIVATFAFPHLVISRMWLVSSWLLTFFFVAANRVAARRLLYSVRGRGYLLSPALIVGSNEEAVGLATFLGDSQSSGVRTLGFVSTEAGDAPTGTTLPVLGSLCQIEAIVKEHGIEDLVVAITAVSREELLRLCELVDPLAVRLRLSSGLYELLTTRVSVQTLGTVPLMSLQKIRLDRGEIVVKTLLDLSLALLGLLVLWPLLVLIAALVKLDSPGPVIHRRRVLGVSGQQFDAFKFRTMVVNGEQLLERQPEAAGQLRDNHKLRQDPRLTKVGRWLRKYSLDELPQLLNVLRGNMSLVGPRMISPEEAEKYGRQRLNLLTVKPGITGLWQVSGRSDLTYEERIRIDMFYVRNYSVWMDLQILFVQTLPAVLNSRGAY